VIEKACPLLVPLVEEGRPPRDPIVRAVLAEYLAPLIEAGVGTVVLGCTHYPLMKDAIAEAMGLAVTLVDSAEAVAEEVRYLLTTYNMLEPSGRGDLRLFVSDNPERFRAVGERFLGERVSQVSHVAPEDFYGSPLSGTPMEDGR
jgi:glutamate racemase